MMSPGKVASPEVISFAPDLSLADRGILEPIVGRPVDQEWLDRVNPSYRLGMQHLKSKDPDEREAIVAARTEFYEEHLGLANAGHELYDAYLINKRARPNLFPTDTFIGTQWVFQEYGLNGVQMCARTANFMYSSPGKVNERLAMLARGGVNVSFAAYTDPSVLQSSKEIVASYIEASRSATNAMQHNEKDKETKQDDGLTPEGRRMRREVLIERFAVALGYENHAEKLLRKVMRLAFSETKLGVHARLFAEHGNPNITPSQVGTFLSKPLELHLITLAEGKPYNTKEISRQHKIYPHKPQRKARMMELLEDREALEAKVGKKVLIAYDRHIAAKKGSSAI